MDSDVSSERPRLAVPPLWRARELAPIIVALGICIAIYVAFALSLGCETSGDDPHEAYYNRLVDGLLTGHVYLAKEVPPPLLAAADPYAPAVVKQAVGLPFTASSVHDLSFYRGRLYLYFSVVPAVVLFLPFRVATGHYLSQQAASVLFTSAGLAIAAVILVQVWRRYFPSGRPLLVGSCVLGIGLVPLLPVLLQRADVYEVPISAAFCFSLGAIYCVWRAAILGYWTPRVVCALSICVGLAAGCRPSEIAIVGLLLLPAADFLRGRAASLLMAAVLPVSVIAAALLAYNWARFGELWEFGTEYQLNVDPANVSRFSIGNLSFNAWHYLLNFPGWSWHFPFAGPWRTTWPAPMSIVGMEHPVGVFAALPCLAFGFGAIGWFRQWETPLRRLVLALTWIATANLTLLCFFFGSCARYEIAFAPYIALVASVVVLTFEHRLRGRTRHLVAFRIGWIALLLFSIGYGVLFAVRARAESYVKLGYRFALAGEWRPALGEFTRALAFDPDSGQALALKAHCEISLGESAAAEADLRALVSRDIANDGAWNRLGVLLSRESGREREALECFERCVALTPNDAEAHCNVGIALLRAGLRHEEAVRQLQLALRLDPTLEAARHALRVAGINPDATD